MRLENGTLWSHDARGALVVRCTSGSVWLTDGRDVVLGPGESHAVKSGRVVVQALETSVLCVSAG